MGLFNWTKKEDKESENYLCGDDLNSKTTSNSDSNKNQKTDIKILGGGCLKCDLLEQSVKEALVELEIDATIEHVSDFSQIAAYGVMTTPALVVNGKVISYGKTLKKNEVITLLKKGGIL